jgi:hypothetical protein
MKNIFVAINVLVRLTLCWRVSFCFEPGLLKRRAACLGRFKSLQSVGYYR